MRAARLDDLGGREVWLPDARVATTALVDAVPPRVRPPVQSSALAGGLRRPHQSLAATWPVPLRDRLPDTFTADGQGFVAISVAEVAGLQTLLAVREVDAVVIHRRRRPPRPSTDGPGESASLLPRQSLATPTRCPRPLAE